MIQKDAIEILKSIQDGLEETRFLERCAIDMAIKALKEKRPNGEWIFHKYDKNYECSNCHVRFDRTQIYTEKRFENALWAKMEMYNFCPNCGADMREGEAE